MERIRDDLKACGVDVDGALNRMMGNESLFLRLMKKFLQDTNFRELKENFEKEDYEEAFKNAHTLKGVSGNLGLNPIMEADIVIVEKLRRHEYEGLDGDLQRLEKVYEEIYRILQKIE